MTLHIKYDSMREGSKRGNVEKNKCVLMKGNHSFAADYTVIRTSLKDILVTD